MMRSWIGLTLLGSSWLWGLTYYRPANGLLWLVAVTLGSLLLSGTPLRLPGRREGALAISLLLPAAWWMPWPYRAATILIAVGLTLHVAPIPGRWPGRIGRGAVASGLILLTQALALWAYECCTARTHELPWPLPSAIGATAALMGAETAVDGNTVAIYTYREVLRLGATWDLLLDPATLAFFVGGLAILGTAVRQSLPRGERRLAWLRAARTLTIVLLAWLPLRLGLLAGLLVHRTIRLDQAARLNPMAQFFSPWVHLALLVPLALAACRLVALSRGGVPSPPAPLPKRERGDDVRQPAGWTWLHPAAWGLVLLGVAVFAFWFYWQPVGRGLEGRVMFMERHSTWSPSMPAYDTTRYGEDGSYNYAAVYDYCAQYFHMSRLLEPDPIDDEKLSSCDVLVIRIPTAPYTAEENEAILRFVQRGGGLLLIGDHTNYEKSSIYLNRITEEFGFKYRHDLLFCTGEPYFQPYAPPAVPHPIVQHVPPMSFAVSCSIDPGRSLGQAVVRGAGLWSLMPNYWFGNWFAEAEYSPDMRYGAFIQLWATTYGSGRVLAWTDSTIFSSFCTFQPGKSELLRGMLDWLNHRSLFDRAWLRWVLAVVVWLVSLALVAGGLRWARIARASSLVLLAATMLGWTAGGLGATIAHRWSLPVPERLAPRLRVVIDRTVSDAPLARGAYIGQEDGAGYGLLEQWIARLGYVTERRSGPEAFEGEILVVICPRRSVPEDYRERLVAFVNRGGKLLVIDSPDSTGSTANSLLWPFGMAVSHASSREGELGLAGGGWPGIPVEGACEIQGGTPWAWVDDLPVAARKRFGEGSVMAIGFGSAVNDANLGFVWLVQPTPEVLVRSELLFALVRALATDQPVVAPPGSGPKAASQKDLSDRP